MSGDLYNKTINKLMSKNMNPLNVNNPYKTIGDLFLCLMF